MNKEIAISVGQPDTQTDTNLVDQPSADLQQEKEFNCVGDYTLLCDLNIDYAELTSHWCKKVHSALNPVKIGSKKINAIKKNSLKADTFLDKLLSSNSPTEMIPRNPRKPIQKLVLIAFCRRLP